MDKIDEKTLKKMAMTLEPAVRVGKNGLTDSVITEIDKHLKKKKIIKIKMLSAFVGDNDKKEIAKQIAEKTRSKLVQAVGFTITIYRP